MTSPRTRHPAQQIWQFDERPARNRNMVVLAATGLWFFIVLLGLVLTFS